MLVREQQRIMDMANRVLDDIYRADTAAWKKDMDDRRLAVLRGSDYLAFGKMADNLFGFDGPSLTSALAAGIIPMGVKRTLMGGRVKLDLEAAGWKAHQPSTGLAEGRAALLELATALGMTKVKWADVQTDVYVMSANLAAADTIAKFAAAIRTFTKAL